MSSGKKTAVKFAFLAFIASLSFVDISSSYFSDRKFSLGNLVKAGCWESPNPPNLSYPANNTFTNKTKIEFSWDLLDVYCEETVYQYKFILSYDKQLNNKLIETDWEEDKNSYTVSNLEEGEYWWQVKVRKNILQSEESNIYKITIDTTPPKVELSVSESPSKKIKQAVANNWIKTGDSDLSEGIYILGREDDPGNYYWENRMMGVFPAEVKTLAFEYRFHTKDDTYSDNPAFLARVNGKLIEKVNAADGNTDWKKVYYDLTDFSDDRYIQLVFSAGNSGDRLKQSWVELKNITTNIAVVGLGANFSLTGTDNSSGISNYEFALDNSDFVKGQNFNIPVKGTHLLKYRGIDNSGNVSETQETEIIVEDSSSSVLYDEIVLSDPDPEKEYENSDINYQDIVINELLWMGSNISTADEYLELRNMTNKVIDLDGFYFTRFDGTGEVDMNIDLSGKSIPANGYFLIGNKKSGYKNGDSVLKNEPDLWDTSLELSNSNFQIRLYSRNGDLIDVAGNGEAPFAGYYNSSQNQYFSMQRAENPNSGIDPINWFTNLDPTTKDAYFKTNADIRGTPGI